jgi:hypothetical protein
MWLPIVTLGGTMKRRKYIQAAAVLLGVSATLPGRAIMSDHDEVNGYNVDTESFGDVTEFRNPMGENTSEEIYRLYDDEADTLIYAMTVGDGGDESVSLVLRDGSKAEFEA